jgi:hypothetical protein
MGVTFRTAGEVFTRRGGEDALCGCVCHSGNHQDCRCWEDCPVAFVSDGPEEDFSQANAIHLLMLLGFDVPPDDELIGEAPAADFLARVLTALATEPWDEGVAPVESPGLLFGRIPVKHMVDCGRRPGYVQDALQRLRALADAAQQLGRNVAWA